MKWKDKTRGGHPVRIYAEDGGGKYPIHGAIDYGEGWVANTWTSEGAITVGGVFSERDIISTTPIIDWSKQPDWCKAAARDRSGNWYRYNCVPSLGKYRWHRPLGMEDTFSQPLHPSEYPTFEGDWKDSLCVRPEGGAQ